MDGLLAMSRLLTWLPIQYKSEKLLRLLSHRHVLPVYHLEEHEDEAGTVAYIFCWFVLLDGKPTEGHYSYCVIRHPRL